MQMIVYNYRINFIFLYKHLVFVNEYGRTFRID